MVLEPVSVDKSGENLGPATPDELLSLLEKLAIPTTLYKHRAVFSVGEADELDNSMPGAHTRNLFIRDKRENMFLITLLANKPVKLDRLADLLGAGRFSFGSPERLMKYLGVTPGSVTPFAMMNDKEHKVTLILDAEMMEQDIVNYHPLINTMTVGLPPSGLTKFLENCGSKFQIIDLSPASGE